MDMAGFSGLFDIFFDIVDQPAVFLCPDHQVHSVVELSFLDEVMEFLQPLHKLLFSAKEAATGLGVRVRV